jgi:predicted kinase
MAKIQPTKPFLLLLYGYPGSGKTYFARQFTESVQAAHLQADRIRGELFENPQYDKKENALVTQLQNYMAEEFMSSGVSVVYDANLVRKGQRQKLTEIARRNGVTPLVVWFQMDIETAFYRNIKRDRRRADDKYAGGWDRSTFDGIVAQMQNPTISEGYLVISGKHLYNMQLSAIASKLRNMGVLSESDASDKVVKPGMINLVPNAGGRVDMSRRNISIRN